MTCPRCNSGVVGRDEDGDVHCWMCGYTEPMAPEERAALEWAEFAQRKRRVRPTVGGLRLW